MIGSAEVRRIAADTGFREETVEKVLYLDAIMSRLVRHPALDGAWVLKGGTALSLFLLDVPRLSVDIDINYIGQTDSFFRCSGWSDAGIPTPHRSRPGSTRRASRRLVSSWSGARPSDGSSIDCVTTARSSPST